MVNVKELRSIRGRVTPPAGPLGEAAPASCVLFAHMVVSEMFQ